MPHPPDPAAELAAADRHIAEAEGRIARQMMLVARLAGNGHDTTAAERLLRAMEEALDTMYAHRRQIVREVAGGDPPATSERRPCRRKRPGCGRRSL